MLANPGADARAAGEEPFAFDALLDLLATDDLFGARPAGVYDRCVAVFARSGAAPSGWSTNAGGSLRNGSFVLDCLYVHEKNAEGNKVQV